MQINNLPLPRIKNNKMPKINTDDYISVREFAHSLGMSTQRIYQVLNNISEKDKLMMGKYLFIKKTAKIHNIKNTAE